MVGAAILIADLFLPVAGQLRSASGREFRTTVWISNVAPRRTTVRATFLERHPLKAAPVPVTFDLGPGETKEIDDLPTQFRRPGVLGAIRFESPDPIAVVAHIFSPESIGNGLTAVSEDAALKKGDEGVLPGVTYDASGDFRQTTYLVETSGRPAGMFVRLRDANGRELAHDSFLLEPYEHRVLRIAELARQTFVRNGSLSIRVAGGSGRVYAIGLQIPNRSGGGYFVEMSIKRSRTPAFSAAEIAIDLLTALAVIASVGFAIFSRRAPPGRM